MIYTAIIAIIASECSTGTVMKIPFIVCTAVGIVLFASSCATTTESLPALDASKTTKTKALVIQVDYVHGFKSPIRVVSGPGEGAATGLGNYLDFTLGCELCMAIGIVLAPIGLPVAAVIGANSAHSKNEVNAAVIAFDRVGQDMELLSSIDRRFVEALDTDTVKQWACIEAVSEEAGEPCSGDTPTAQIALRPSFGLIAYGDKYDPELLFLGSVVAIVSLEQATPVAKSSTVVEAKWAYREKLGEYFELAKNDAVLLRGKLEIILDRFAARIAGDLYMAPRSEILERKKNSFTRPFVEPWLEIPDGVVARIEQGSDLFSLATHGMVQTTGFSAYEACWIKAVDGKATGSKSAYNLVPVKRGVVSLDVTCPTRQRSTPDIPWTPRADKQEELSIEVRVEPGALYFTDGHTYRLLRHVFNCNFNEIHCRSFYW